MLITTTIGRRSRALLSRGEIRSFSFSTAIAVPRGGTARRAGGLAVLAHPFTLGITEPGELTVLIQELQEMGLAGLEVFYPDPEQRARVFAAIERADGSSEEVAVTLRSAEDIQVRPAIR